MTKEELIKNLFPNDEFLQFAALRSVDKYNAELKKENAELRAKESFVIGNEPIKEIHEKD